MHRREFSYYLIISLIAIFMPGLPAAAEAGSLVWMPVFFTTPETGLAGGTYAIYYDVPELAVSGSYNLGRSYLIVTEKQQSMLGCELDWQCDSGRFQTALSLSRYPQLFYGIGPDSLLSDEESYSQTETLVSAWYQFASQDTARWGPIVSVQNYRTDSMRHNGQLSSGVIPGSRGAFVTGIGLGYQYDSRDSIFATQRGCFFSIKGLGYTGMSGGDGDCYKLEMDYRHFITPAQAHVIGLQWIVTTTGGNVPFQLMSRLGGASIMRGFYYGRYIDRCLTAAQAEYRFPLAGNLGGAIFVSGGGVSPSPDRFTSRVFHLAYGCGIRYCIDPKQGISIRFDYGRYDEQKEKASMIYITIMEAF